MDIYLLRHGQTLQPGTYTGSTDVELSAEGRRQIRVLSPFLQSRDFDHCFSSPLVRCRETVSLLELNRTCSIEESLREIDFGAWEGLNFNEIQNAYPEQLSRWVSEGDNFTFPGGGHIGTFHVQITDWFDKLLTKGLNRVLIVAHGGVLRAGICHLIGIELSRAFTLNPREGRVSMVTMHDGGGHLELFNCSG